MIQLRRFFFPYIVYILILVIHGSYVEAISPTPPNDLKSNDSLESSIPLTTTDWPPYLGTEIVVSGENNIKNAPAVAYNWKHKEYMVVWERYSGTNPGIYGQRLTGNGELIGPTPIPIATGPKRRRNPDVDYDPVNDRYFVVWSHDVTGDGSNWDISGRFIPWQGTGPTPDEQKICDESLNQKFPKVVYARGQEEFLVLWIDHFVGFGLRGTRIYADGSGQRDYYLHPPATVADWWFDVAYNHFLNEFLIVYEGPGNLWPEIPTYLSGIQLRYDGSVKPPGEFGIDEKYGYYSYPNVGACPKLDFYLVVWGYVNDISATFVSGDGTVDTSTYSVSGTSNNEVRPDVSCNNSGEQFLIVWSQGPSDADVLGVGGRFVYADKSMSPAFEIAPGAGEFQDMEEIRRIAAVGGGPSNYLVIWEYKRELSLFKDIYGKLVFSQTMPEIKVLDGETNILNGTSSVDFGITTVGTPIDKTFTVMNDGTADLILTKPITVPSGFSVTSSFGSLAVPAGNSTTFIIQLSATAVGTYAGTLQFDNNDDDENPFNFTISGIVTLPEIDVYLPMVIR